MQAQQNSSELTLEIHEMVQAAAENPWRARYAWFWYNSKEIWHFSQADMDAKVKRYADQGFTHLITFSCTHFRWTFQPWWKEINECLRKIVVSAHRYGLKVIEHHSSNLTYFPRTENDLQRFQTNLRKRKSCLEDWPGLLEYALDETAEAEQWCQIDAVTGEKCFTHYTGHAKCPNNPHYMAAYLKYLESVYATGVDGIMTDDMYAFPNMVRGADGKVRALPRSCGCGYCRKRFREQYGRDFPPPEKWDGWFHAMNDPSFIDFLKFRRESFMDFHRKVAAHYKSLGLKMIRPNYDAVAFRHDHEAGVAGTFPELDIYFQECMHSYVIRYSWPLFLFEQKVRAEYSRLRKIPHMMMFYADRPDSLIFSFGLCRLAGAMFTNTPEGENNVDETVVRNFENTYHDLLFPADDMPMVGFIDSEKNRFYSAGFFENRTSFWMQTAIFRNLPAVMYSISEPENWKTPLLILNEVRLLSEPEIRALKKYAENGGTLVLTGICGEQDENAAFRSRKQLQALWGFDLFDDSYADRWKLFPLGKGRICRVGYHFGYPGTKEENQLRFVYDERRRTRNYVSPKQEMLAVPLARKQQKNTSSTQHPQPDYNYYDRNSPYFDRIAALLRQLAGSRLNFRTEFPDLILAQPYFASRRNCVVIHLVNAAGTLPKDRDEVISHAFPIPFPAWSGPDGKIFIRPPESLKNGKAVWVDLSGKETPLDLANEPDGMMKIILPAGMLKNYGMILIR